MQTQISHELTLQIKERQAKNRAEEVERKTKVMTSGGPEQDLDQLHKKAKQQKMLVQLNLNKQKDMEAMEKQAKKSISMEQEREDAQRIAAKHLEARLHK